VNNLQEQHNKVRQDDVMGMRQLLTQANGDVEVEKKRGELL